MLTVTLLLLGQRGEIIYIYIYIYSFIPNISIKEPNKTSRCFYLSSLN